MLDGRAGDNVQDVDTDCCIILKIRDLDGCRRCKYKFGEFTGTYIGEFNFSLDNLHLAYSSLWESLHTGSGFMYHLV